MQRQIVGCVAFFLWSCQATAPHSAVVRDSSGVRLVGHLDFPLQADRWQVAGTEITIGAQDQAPGNALFRVAGAHCFPDGRIVIANAGTAQLRFFDAQGEFTHAVGGEGEGPGEFGRLQWVQARQGDTLVVFDGGHARLVEFDPTGAYIRTVRLQSTENIRLPIPILVFPDGATFAEAAVRMRAAATAGIERSVATVFGYDRDGAYVAPLGAYPGIDVWVGMRPTGNLGRATPFFGKTTRFRRAGAHFVVADNAISGFDTYDQDGQLAVRVRWEGGDLAVGPGATERARAAMLEGVDDPEQRRVLAAWYARIPAAEMLPAFEDLLVADSGEYWVQRYGTPNSGSSVTWMVFSPEGLFQAHVQVPRDVGLLQIGSDFVLVQTRDADDVELVEVRRLQREAV